jgi:hypothetical protein
MRYEDEFECSCGNKTFTLDDKQLQEGIAYKICCKCGKKHRLEVDLERCFGCGRPYYALTWCIPSGCRWCHKTFVD